MSGRLVDATPWPLRRRCCHVALDPSGGGHVVFYDTRHSDGAGPRVEVYYAGLRR